jgi:hypothetical protein
MGNFFKSGSWNFICDVCGFKKKIEEGRKRWDGLLVCEEDWETDHPQKYLRVRESGLSVPIIRDEPEDNFILVCTVITNQGIAGLGVAGCMVAGRNNHIPS